MILWIAVKLRSMLSYNIFCMPHLHRAVYKLQIVATREVLSLRSRPTDRARRTGRIQGVPRLVSWCTWALVKEEIITEKTETVSVQGFAVPVRTLCMTGYL